MTEGRFSCLHFPMRWVVRMNGKLKSRQKGSLAKIIWIPGPVIIFGWVKVPDPLKVWDTQTIYKIQIGYKLLII